MSEAGFTHLLAGLAAVFPDPSAGEDARHVLALAAAMRRELLPMGGKDAPAAILDYVRGRTAGELGYDLQNALAGVLALHRREVKPAQLPEFGLAPVQVQQTLALASLLQLADHLSQALPAADEMEVRLSDEGGVWLICPDTAGCNTAAQVVAAFEKRWVRAGLPPLETLTSQQAHFRSLPFPSKLKAIGLARDDRLDAAARKVMRFHYARMLDNEAGTRLGEDVEALHDMRVSTRRLRAAFVVFESAFDPPALKPHLKGLRRCGRVLGAVRDLDVFLAKAESYALERETDLSDLLAAWQAERHAARGEMLTYLDSSEYAHFKRGFNTFLHDADAVQPAPSSERPFPLRVRAAAPALIYDRLAVVRSYGPYLPGAPVERLHALRIEFKKLRYTVEYFQEALGVRAGDVIAAIKLLQDHLGNLNDAAVASARLETFLESHAAPGVQSYLDFQRAEERRLQDSFEAVWKAHFAGATFRRRLATAVGVL